MINLDNLLNLILTVSVTLISAFLGFKAAGVNDRNSTSKYMLEKVYFPIFNLIEKDLYKEISLAQAIEYGHKILDIINQNPMYVYPSLKLYTEYLIESNKNTYKENFKHVCWSVEKYYDKFSKRIGLPLRSYAYRINTQQYENRSQLLLYCFLLKLPELLIDIVFFVLIYYFTKIR